MEYSKKEQYPSWSTPGVYPDGSVKELGLNNDNLEDFSLGNINGDFKAHLFFSLKFASFNLFKSSKLT